MTSFPQPSSYGLNNREEYVLYSLLANNLEGQFEFKLSKVRLEKFKQTYLPYSILSKSVVRFAQ